MTSAARIKPIRLLRTAFALCFIVTLAWSAILLWRAHEGRVQQAELITLHESAKASVPVPTTAPTRPDAQPPEDAGGPSPTPYVDPLSAVNPDYYGWLTVYGTSVDYPVVLGRDNSYYLTHDFYGAYSASGCLFADALCEPDGAGNILIYGHHMKNGSMFGSLKAVKSASFFDDHGTLLWEQGGRTAYYEIFAVLVVPGYEDAADYFPIQDYLGELEAEKTEQLLSELQARAIIYQDAHVTETDRLMFLITCDYTRSNGRMLLCAKRL